MSMLTVSMMTILLAQSPSLPKPDSNGNYFFTISAKNAYLYSLVWKVQTDAINCRTKAGMNGAVLKTLQQGQLVGSPNGVQPFAKDAEGNPWIRVYIPKTEPCYVRANTKFIRPNYIESR